MPIAHRALHDRARGRPENSRAAVAAAVARGYGIEIDVQLSADGRAIVFHDETLERLTPEHGPLAARTAAELARIPLRDGGGETIPTLTDILALVAGRVALLIEVKDQDGAMGPGVGALEAAVAGELAGHPGPVAVMSFNPHSVAALARAAPGVPRGLVTSAWAARDWPGLSRELRERLREIPDFDAVGAAFISHEAADLARPRVAELKARGAVILCWTIRSPEAEALARRIADNVTFEGYLAAIPPA
jgi:glycerophosphoryl diester phosphodiesterase